MLSKMSKENLEMLSYAKIAELYLKENKKPMNTADLFKEVCKLLELSDEEYQERIGDFFESLTTSKEFILLNDGNWDLRANHSVKIDIDDEGKCVIYHNNQEMLDKAKNMIENIIREAKVGEEFDAKVVRIEKFGAFVELFPGTDGLLHVSKISYERVEKPEDVLKLGDTIKVKVTEIDDKGRVNVSHREFTEKPEGWDETQKERKERQRPTGEKRVFKKKD